MESYEVVVIGGGGAGEWAASNVASGGRSVAMVEERLVGGECPYWACMPAKALLHAAEIRHLAQQAHAYGATSRPLPLDDPAAAYHAAVALRNRVAEHHSDHGAASRFLESGAALLRGRGRVTAPGVVEVTDRDGQTSEIGFTELVIATGTKAFVPPIEGIDDVDFWDSERFYTSGELPRSIVIVGGGPIGLEIAQTCARFDSAVTVVEMAPHVLPAEDAQIAEELQAALAEEGIVIHAGTAARRVERSDEGVRVTLSSGASVTAERLIVVAGKVPLLEHLGLEHAGWRYEPRKFLEIDEHCKVKGTEHLWAGGDITGVAPFTHTANYHGRILTENLLGRPVKGDFAAIPRAVYTDPAVASVGLTEQQAREAGHDVITAQHWMNDTARAFATRRGGGLLKLVADRERGVLLGMSALGPHIEELVGEAVIAIRAQIPIAVLADVIHPFPTYSEAYEPPLRDLAAQLG